MAIETFSDIVKKHDKVERLASLHAEVEQYKNLREYVFSEMIKRGEKKDKNYKPFIKGVRAFKHLPESREQGIFLENYYVALRCIDDIADGDLELPENYESTVQYVQDKIDFIESGRLPKDEIEKLIVLSFKIGDEFGADFHQETLDILNSILFDAKRQNEHTIFDEKTLHDHFYTLDIKGGVKASLKVFGEDPNLYEILEPLGEAERIYYNLRDFKEDTEAGLVNISSEDCVRLSITQEILTSGAYENHDGIRAWFKEQAEEGLRLVDEYYNRKKGIKFKPVTKLALKFGFEAMAKRFLENVVRGNFEKILD